ncbi:MAG TPA: hypothetical protein VFY54_21750, partial [Rubrobacter sp.]|nr:hypothetical protein [Rubrobacter sp.]
DWSFRCECWLALLAFVVGLSLTRPSTKTIRSFPRGSMRPSRRKRAISLAMIVLLWGGLVVGSAFFALVFDLAVIAVVLWQLRSGALIS